MAVRDLKRKQTMHFEDPAGTLEELTTRVVTMRDSL
jgi:hypothetical protein